VKGWDLSRACARGCEDARFRMCPRLPRAEVVYKNAGPPCGLRAGGTMSRQPCPIVDPET